MHVAFFRNLNLGQPRSPSRVQLVEAFTAEGARDVLSHQSNGTVAFSCDGDPQALADAVAASLGPLCGYADVALVRPLDWLRDLGLHDLPDGCELTVFDGLDVFPELIPWSPDPRVTVLRADGRHAVVHNHEERRSYGTRVVEQRPRRPCHLARRGDRPAAAGASGRDLTRGASPLRARNHGW